MTDENQTPDARAAEDMGEQPDPARKADALGQALTGSGMGSDTRAGSLQGGASTGSDDDPDQDTIDEALAREGTASADPNPINDTGAGKTGPAADPAEGKPGEADATAG